MGDFWVPQYQIVGRPGRVSPQMWESVGKQLKVRRWAVCVCEVNQLLVNVNVKCEYECYSASASEMRIKC